MNNAMDYYNPYYRSSESFCGSAYDFKPMTSLPENPMVTMSYTPFQVSMNTYDADEALQNGTLFPCLNKPFLGKGGCRR